jgi:hypothetical protein
MTEPESTLQPGGEERPHAPVDEDAGRPGTGRTAGETTVDDDLGQGDPPQR